MSVETPGRLAAAENALEQTQRLAQRLADLVRQLIPAAQQCQRLEALLIGLGYRPLVDDVRADLIGFSSLGLDDLITRAKREVNS
jgi:hypothetical protein